MSDRILVVGRGAAGISLAEDIRRRGGDVVGFLDDRVSAEDVLGTLAQVNEVVAEHAIDLVYFAIPTVRAETVRDFINSIESKTVDIAIVPRTYDILAKETVSIDDLTDVDVLDLVGREPVSTSSIVGCDASAISSRASTPVATGAPRSPVAGAQRAPRPAHPRGRSGPGRLRGLVGERDVLPHPEPGPGRCARAAHRRHQEPSAP